MEIEDPIDRLLLEVVKLRAKIEELKKDKILPSLPKLPTFPELPPPPPGWKLGPFPTPFPKRLPKFGNKHTPTPVTDTRTGITYPTLNQCGQALASEIGITPSTDTWVYYKVKKEFPGRFKEHGQ